ncbi:MAG: DnaD domain protein [Clostridia bacterium]|nr:DnaD domain protein [Clostridia bacterium]
MVYRLSRTAPDDLILLPGDLLKKLDAAGLTETRILLHVAAHLSRGPQTEESIVGDLEGVFKQDEVRRALAFWRGVGILETRADRDRVDRKRSASASPEAAPEPAPEEIPPARKALPDPDVPPFYSGKDLEEAAKGNPGYVALVEHVEKKLGKVLNTSELATLWSYIDYLKMPSEVLMLIVEDCCMRGHGNLRYISKYVMALQDQGLDTYEKAEAYYYRQNQKRTFANRIRTLFGIERALSKSEEALVEEWAGWAFSDEMLDLAYEKTVSTARKPSIKYMHKILESWHETGIATPAQAEAGAAPRQAPDARGEKTYDLNTAFEKAVERQRKGIK